MEFYTIEMGLRISIDCFLGLRQRTAIMFSKSVHLFDYNENSGSRVIAIMF